MGFAGIGIQDEHVHQEPDQPAAGGSAGIKHKAGHALDDKEDDVGEKNTEEEIEMEKYVQILCQSQT